eukprot:gene8538-362_t
MRFSARESRSLLDEYYEPPKTFPQNILATTRCLVPICFLMNYLILEQDQQIIIDGHKRYYILHFPKNFNKTEKVPLVVALHGGFGNARQFKRTSGWDAVSDENNFITLYPYGYSKSGRLYLLGWNSGTIVSEAYETNVSDVSFLRQLTQKVITEHNIDKSKVYCSGHSNGAMMCYRMSGDVPKLFNGIAPVSGTCGGQINKNSPKFIIPTPTNPVKLVHVHGLKDINVKINGGVGEGPGGRGRIDLGINETLNIFTKSNQCQSEFDVERSQNDLIQYRKYKCPNDDSNIQLYYIKNRAHSWSDMSVDVM